MSTTESKYVMVAERDLAFLEGKKLPPDFYREGVEAFQAGRRWVLKEEFLALAKEAGLKFATRAEIQAREAAAQEAK